MAIAKMKLVNIVGRLKDFDETVRSCCLNGDFHPEKSSESLKDVEDFSPIEEANPYSQTLQQITDIGVHSEIELKYKSFDELGMSDTQIDAFITKLRDDLDGLNGKVSSLKAEISRMQQALTQLSHIRSFKVNLDDVFTCKFFRFRFGRLPKDSYPKLELCEEKDNLFFFPLEEDKQYYWGFYVALDTVCDQVDQLFTSLYFERINFLEETHGTPEEAIADISKKLEAEKASLEEGEAAVKAYWEENLDKFLCVYSKVKYLSDSFNVRKYASKCGDTFYIFGWIPEENAEKFSAQFENQPNVDCVVESIDKANGIVPPTKLKHKAVTKSFELITGLYGMPAYNEVDPTSFMALSYSLFFGIMFGDLGQGILIFFIGLLCKLKKLLGDMGGVLMSFGIASSVFGFLYNSVFGHEGVLPFTILPVHDDKYILTVLFSAVGFGVVVILSCMVINMINGVKQKNIKKLLFDTNGLAGFVMYASIIIGCVFFLLFKKNVFNLAYIIGLILLPILLIFLSEPLSRLIEHKKEIIPGAKGEFFITAFFDLFEAFLSFFSNTISFMRIGAYILSHAGMMMAVFAIGGMFHTTGNIIAQVIGNVFVIALEGLIVGIQGIRLHFYEMFSRFYAGDGKPYDPIKINY